MSEQKIQVRLETVSVGIWLTVIVGLGAGRESPEALIRDADAALYRAKERGRGAYEIFDEAMLRWRHPERGLLSPGSPPPSRGSAAATPRASTSATRSPPRRYRIS